MSKHKKIRRLRRIIVFTSAFVLMIGVPVLRYYVSTPGINACVLEYVDNMEESDYKGNMYNIDGLRHIEPNNSNLNDGLEQYKVGEANGCLMASDNLFIDLNNTFYCTVTYIIKKLPIKEKYKEPLGIMKEE